MPIVTTPPRELVFDADDLKVREYLERWHFDSARETVRPTTFERYEQIVRAHIRPVWKLVDEGAIKVRRVGRAVRINRASLDSYMNGEGPDASGDDG